MDYVAQLLARDRHREFAREADDARLASLVSPQPPHGKPAGRNRQRAPFREGS